MNLPPARYKFKAWRISRLRQVLEPNPLVLQKLKTHRLVLRLWYGTLYRPVMKLAHRFHWHYAPPIYPEGDTVLWCKWCGLSDTVKRRNKDIVTCYKK